MCPPREININIKPKEIITSYFADILISYLFWIFNVATHLLYFLQNADVYVPRVPLVRWICYVRGMTVECAVCWKNTPRWLNKSYAKAE
jgi:hypothetical protein